MGIARNAGGGGRGLDPGEYVVRVHEMKQGNSKSGKPMLTITFQTEDEKTISGYFCKPVQFHMHNLRTLKEAAGLKADDPAERLHGKYVGILVEQQAPTEDGKIFMQISGYGPSSEVHGHTAPQDGGFAHGSAQGDDEVPF